VAAFFIFFMLIYGASEWRYGACYSGLKTLVRCVVRVTLNNIPFNKCVSGYSNGANNK